MNKIKSLIIVLLFSVPAYSQSEKEFPLLSDSDIEGGKILRTSYYDGTSLWGLINGGADIYLEYGFDKLLFQEWEIKGSKFRAEIYKMYDGKGAFGIFSVSRYKCSELDTLTKFLCSTPYQVQAAIGKYYISISNESGDKVGSGLTLNLFSKYLSKINETPVLVPDLFGRKSFAQYKNQLKFIKGRLGIQNGFPAWIEMFDPYNDYEIYLLPLESSGGYAYIALIKFISGEEL
ncbi:MAG: DUF6599 family protein, partial [Melioribacteraceae bacterium]